MSFVTMHRTSEASVASSAHKAAPYVSTLHTVSSVNTVPNHRIISCACGGSCPKCRTEQTVQPKLVISAPGDKHEQEADRIADQVMDMDHHEHSAGIAAALTGISATKPYIARAPSRAGRKLPKGVAPQWPEVPAYVQSDLDKTGFGTGWFTTKTALARQTILNLYVKLKGLDLWRYIETNARTSSDTTLEFNAKHHELREVLTDREDFTDPDDTLNKWSSREKKASASLHFKHFNGWPEKQVQAHIDPIGVHGSSIPIIGPLILGIRHLLDYSGYKDAFRIRNILLDEGWDPVALSGVTASPVMRKAANNSYNFSATNGFASINRLQNGQPLPATLRHFFEPRFGRDFSQVRVYTDTNAANTAQSINARAYTLGTNVVFNAGQYAPHTHEGKRLMAHELTHVIQQRGAEHLVQREPVFPDESCSDGNKQERIIRYTSTALGLVRNALSAMQDLDAVAGQLSNWFHIDVNNEIDRNFWIPDYVVKRLEKMESLLNGQIDNRCEDSCNYRAKVIGIGRPENGVYFCSRIFNFFDFTLPHQIVNTLLHEYAHMAGVEHGREEDEQNEYSLVVRGWTKDQALNHAEVFARFIRSIQ